jgi:branched-chain amino acid transport system ATP-binding protein
VSAAAPLMLAMRDVSAGYGRSTVLQNISLEVATGTIVSVVGPNGAGKTTLLKVLSGVVECRSGEIEMQGQRLNRLSTSQRAKRRLVLCPEGRHLFSTLTVEENLRLGAEAVGRRFDRASLGRVLELFPIIGDRLRQKAGTMSGGEQQMVAIARALMADPIVLCVDEPTQGLALNVIENLAEALVALRRDGLTVVMAEQDTQLALAVSDAVYVMSEGRFTGRVSDDELRSGSELPSFFEHALRDAGLA